MLRCCSMRVCALGWNYTVTTISIRTTRPVDDRTFISSTALCFAFIASYKQRVSRPWREQFKYRYCCFDAAGKTPSRREWWAIRAIEKWGDWKVERGSTGATPRCRKAGRRAHRYVPLERHFAIMHNIHTESHSVIETIRHVTVILTIS